MSESLDLLREASRDPHHRVATTALAALAARGDADAVARLVRLAHDERIEFRLAATWGLGRCGGPPAVECLAALVKDSNPKVRLMAVRSLARLRREAAQAAPTQPPVSRAETDPAGSVPMADASAAS